MLTIQQLAATSSLEPPPYDEPIIPAENHPNDLLSHDLDLHSYDLDLHYHQQCSGNIIMPPYEDNIGLQNIDDYQPQSHTHYYKDSLHNEDLEVNSQQYEDLDSSKPFNQQFSEDIGYTWNQEYFAQINNERMYYHDEVLNHLESDMRRQKYLYCENSQSCSQEQYDYLSLSNDNYGRNCNSSHSAFTEYLLHNKEEYNTNYNLYPEGSSKMDHYKDYTRDHVNQDSSTLSSSTPSSLERYFLHSDWKDSAFEGK